ncbi:hypothetical protein [Dyadobacter sp. CY347]|uniref:hypothetical protein n=1 Tax=Dyadobacter sp. CY347 TaxID=2909336 RepID=UPI001F1AC132|nr:hypothetical protein [Dyadobacter sp. CY347]MCF2487464.1 hypothetical protein [Dyadobacter sp. CY347]
MELAIIISGFYAESTSVKVVADVADGIDVLIYDDETKQILGSALTADGSANITVSPILYAGQRIIAYLAEFGQDTYGSLVVTESETEHTGWKTPETVNGQSYKAYLIAGGAALPDLYDPASCRNFSRDKDSIDRAIDVPISFILRQIESQGGTVQVVIENISGAIGGYKSKFDGDAQGTNLSKTYSDSGNYQVKVWGVNQVEAQAITKTYSLTMPTASIDFGSTVVDLTYFADYGNNTSPGLRPLRVTVYSSVPVEVQIDGVHTWAVASSTGMQPNETGRYDGPVHFVEEGEYTIRCRKASDSSQELVRQIKLNNYFS